MPSQMTVFPNSSDSATHDSFSRATNHTPTSFGGTLVISIGQFVDLLFCSTTMNKNNKIKTKFVLLFLIDQNNKIKCFCSVRTKQNNKIKNRTLFFCYFDRSKFVNKIRFDQPKRVIISSVFAILSLSWTRECNCGFVIFLWFCVRNLHFRKVLKDFSPPKRAD